MIIEKKMLIRKQDYEDNIKHVIDTLGSLSIDVRSLYLKINPNDLATYPWGEKHQYTFTVEGIFGSTLADYERIPVKLKEITIKSYTTPNIVENHFITFTDDDDPHMEELK